MRVLLNHIMARRAERLVDWLAPHLPIEGPVLDIGAGTGHNAVALRRRRGGIVLNLDVADLRVVGERPTRFDGFHMPFADDRFAAALILFVIQYSPDPVQLLREAARVCHGPVLVLQSTYAGRVSEAALRLYDLAWGPLAFTVARVAGLVAAERAPLFARVLASRSMLQRTFAAAHLRPRLLRTAYWPLLAVQRDLYILERLPARSNAR
jgi:SAM-dependent methyltransferase